MFRYPWNGSFFDDWSDEVAWLLGIIWSDGYLDRGNRVSVCSKDRDLIDCIAHLISQQNGVRPKNGGRHWSIGFSSPHAADRLRSLGLMTAKSHIIAWPNELPEAHEAAFVRGLIDGDGSVLLSKRRPGQQCPDLRVSLCSASEELMNGFLDWCSRNGLAAQHYVRGSFHTALIMQQASLRALYALLYPAPDVPCLARKREKYDAWIAIPRAPAGRPRADSRTPRSERAAAPSPPSPRPSEGEEPTS
ncbi:LAGLIDADG family homing endonuclease [Streptomyces sp. NPDC056663]|uniref:LAGLIDADG family homing endonuclease n=1 Tax=Streptomyces sp. NPDC056663 TaxID=3345899 RepID=UPI0036A4F91B